MAEHGGAPGSTRDAVDPRVVERAASGDRDALRVVWHGTRRYAAAVLLAHKHPGDEVADLLQEVAVKVVEHIHTLKDSEAFRPWLRQVSMNVARASARTRNRRREPEPSAIITDVAVQDDPSSNTDVLDRLADLPDTLREPLVMRARGMAHRTIAADLGVPVTTIESRLARARRMLSAAASTSPTAAEHEELLS